MSLSKELLLSVLAMDAYNRGYEPGIADLGGAGSKLGGATIKNVDLPAGSEAAGFYALSYTISGSGTDLDGKTVISYRGTDKNDITLTGAGSDLVNGYGLAVGSYSATQVELAAKFYQSVRGDISRNSFVLTGHSMGAFQRAEARA